MLGYDFSIRLWDSSTGQLTQDVGGTYVISPKVHFTPDGKGIVWAAPTERSAGRGTLDVRGRGNRTYAIHEIGEFDTLGVALSPDGKSITSINYDPNDKKPLALAIVWDVQTGKRLLQRQSHLLLFSVYDLPLSADGKLLAEPADKGLTLQEVTAGQELLSLELSNLQPGEKLRGLVAFSPDGRAVAAVTHAPIPGERLHELADCSIHLWELATRRTIRRIPGIKNALNALAFSPDGRTFAVEGLLEVLGPRLGKGTSHLSGTGRPCLCRALTFSPDGTRLAAGYYDSTAIVWDLTPGLRRAKMAPKSLTPDALQRLWLDLAAEDPSSGHAALCKIRCHPWPRPFRC